MNLETLRKILDLNQRESLLIDILKFFDELNTKEKISYEKYETSEGIIPVIYIANSLEVNKVKYVKMFVGAQHNEFNGLFAVMEFLRMIQENKVNIKEILNNEQIIIFLPLMNSYGFLNPSKQNKSGYYLKDGANLNRFWRREFAPEYKNLCDDQNEYPIPEHAKIVKKILKKYWEREDISIYILDFHETSLLKRFQDDLSVGLKKESIIYKFDHWLKESIIKNMMMLYDIKYFREPLFFKCKPSEDHNHISLSIKLLDTVHKKLLEYIVKNRDKLPFYFCYSDKGKEICERLANIVHNKLKNKLWETNFPVVEHFHDHGCFVMMGDATIRPNVYSMELESQKQFFDIFEEIEKSKTEPDYFTNKLKMGNLSIELALETIKELIRLF